MMTSEGEVHVQESGEASLDQEGACSLRMIRDENDSWMISYTKLQRLNLPRKLYPQVLI